MKPLIQLSLFCCIYSLTEVKVLPIINSKCNFLDIGIRKCKYVFYSSEFLSGNMISDDNLRGIYNNKILSQYPRNIEMVLCNIHYSPKRIFRIYLYCL